MAGSSGGTHPLRLCLAVACVLASAAAFDECGLENGGASPRATCAARGQMCVDPDWANDGDWACVCHTILGFTAYVSQEGGPATCAYPAGKPCATEAATCHAAGQACVDRQLSGDFECRPIFPFFTTAAPLRQTATTDVHIDECTASCSTCAGGHVGVAGNVCYQNGQGCIDADTARTNTWQCVCAGYEANSSTTIVGDPRKAATCTHPAGSNCLDSNTEAECTNERTACDDVRLDADAGKACRCVGPQRDTAGVCSFLDECTSACPTCADTGGGNICWAVGQDCEDPKQDFENVRDWYCLCPHQDANVPRRPDPTRLLLPQDCPASGNCPEAACGVNQYCTDRDPSAPGKDKWVCACVPPYVGTETVGGPALCLLDECAAVCPTCNGWKRGLCGTYGQACEDTNTAMDSLLDWRCSCEGNVAREARVPAGCISPAGGCSEAESRACWLFGNTCVFDRTARCECIPPYSTVQIGNPNSASIGAVCSLDECSIRAISDVCNVGNPVNQECYDPSELVRDDWTCRCTCAGCRGEARRQPATCILDECLAICTGCAQATTDSEHTCINNGQSCEDQNRHYASKGDWVCSCLGDSVQGAARGQCTPPQPESRNECAFFEPMCRSAGQYCADPDVNVRGDWYCGCVTSVVTKVGGVAECLHDECSTMMRCPDKQQCRDPFPVEASLGDWYCYCDNRPTPNTAGMKIGGPATCIQNECLFQRDLEICTSDGQECFDPDFETAGDWQCRCLHDPTQMLEGTAKLRGAMFACTYPAGDECNTNAATCIAQQQGCVDPSPAQGDWTCKCLPPLATDGGAQAAGTCTVDECTAVCSHCAKRRADQDDTCTMAGQQCVDPDPLTFGDWVCNCTQGAGQAVGLPAACTLDECRLPGVTCPPLQQCVDPNVIVSSLNDWYCVCESGGGLERAGEAECQVNECRSQGATCRDIGQICDDVGTDAISINDWACRCPTPATGSAQGVQAVCTYPNGSECADMAVSTVCTSMGQKCVDGAIGAPGGWTCQCLFPAQGTPQTGAPATCVVPDEVDECTNPDNICKTEGQACFDSDMTTLYTWSCVCSNGGNGFLTQLVPQGACRPNFDECAETCMTCANTGSGPLCGSQICSDGPGAKDWSCLCPLQPGQAAPSRALNGQCLDECAETPCGDQVCMDPESTLTSTGDFVCTCDSVNATAVGQEAVCDECLTDPCEFDEQACMDTNTSDSSNNDFVCTCPNGVSEFGAPAACLDECDANPCGTAQTCRDPTTGTTETGDYTCSCVNVTARAFGRPASCDECAAMPGPCGDGQTCNDPSPSDASLGDFVCTCATNGVVGTPGRPAICTVDECLIRPCGAAQSCRDPDHNFPGNFVCTCPVDQREVVGRPASPCGEYVDECDACLGANPALCPCPVATEVCDDPTKHFWSKYDYTCTCRSTGYVQTGRAVGNCALPPVVPPPSRGTPEGGQRWFFEFQSRLEPSEYSESLMADAIVRVVNLHHTNGSTDRNYVLCEGCELVTRSNIVQHCYTFTDEGQVCRDIDFYYTNTNPTAANGTTTGSIAASVLVRAARMLQAVESEGVFEFIGPNDVAKTKWVEALSATDNREEMRNSPHIEMVGGTYAAQSTGGEEDSGDGTKWWVVILIIVAVLCCCVIVAICFFRRNEAKTQAEQKERAMQQYQREMHNMQTEEGAGGAGDSDEQPITHRDAFEADEPALQSNSGFGDDNVQRAREISNGSDRQSEPFPPASKGAGGEDAGGDGGKVQNPIPSVFPAAAGGAAGGALAGAAMANGHNARHANGYHEQYDGYDGSERGVMSAGGGAGAFGNSLRKETVVIGCGRNIEGQLGIGESEACVVQYTPLEIHELTGLAINTIVCGSFHTVIVCAADATVLVFGEGSDGQLGLGNRLSPKYPTEVPFFKGKMPFLVACGEQHTIIATREENGVPGGNVYAFGAGADGQLGLGTNSSALVPTAIPAFAGAGERTDLIRCGTHHTVVVHMGALYSFGYNEYGQLGTGDAIVRMEPTPIEFFRGKHVRDVACGVVHTVVLCTDGLFVMGRNNHGQLGVDGATGPDAPIYCTPQRLSFFDGMLVKQVSAWYHTMVSTETGLFAFGEADFGKLGTDPYANYGEDSTPADVPTPRLVEYFTGRDVFNVIAGSYHSVVHCRDGVYIWGNADNGKLGHGHTDPITNPAASLLQCLQAYVPHHVAVGIDHTLIYASPR